MPVARIGIPAGLSVPVWQIDDLVDHGLVAALEVNAGEIVLYWEGIDPGARRAVSLDLLAELPGTTVGATSSAWPYYTSDARSWTEPLVVTVLRP